MVNASRPCLAETRQERVPQRMNHEPRREFQFITNHRVLVRENCSIQDDPETGLDSNTR